MGTRGIAVDQHRRARLKRQIRLGLTLQQIADLEGCSRQNIQQLVGSVRSLRAPKGPRPPIDTDSRTLRRFWSRVSVDPSGCWLWTGALSLAGYGHAGSPRVNGDQYAHRAAYIAVKGPIPEGLGLDHLCRVRHCVNPEHLEAVTQRENIMRSPIQVSAINARKTHCKRGHELPPIGSSRVRTCATCRRVRTPEQIAAKRAYDRDRYARLGQRTGQRRVAA